MYASRLEMPFTISCVTCGGDFRIPESLFATRFAGRETKIKCKKCGGLIVVDGGARVSRPERVSTPPSPGRVSTPPSPGRASRPPARPSTLSGRRSVLTASGPRRPSRPPPLAAPAGESTSISSASLRAVEVPKPASDSEPPEILVPSPTESAVLAASIEASKALPASAGSKAVPRAAKGGWLVLGAGAVLALGVGLTRPGPAREERASASVAAAATSQAGLELLAERPSDPLPATPAPPESVVAEVPPPSAAPAPSAIPATPPSAPAYDEKALEGALHWGISNAEQCHREGRPSGTAKAILTFGPAGKVLHVELAGEPIASNPVSKCILSFLRSMMIPAFAGLEFTITREITLR